MRQIRITTSILLLAALPPASAALAGGTLDVPGPLDLSIQEAINIAPSLGVTEIIIAPGTYNENVDLKGLAVWLHSSGGAAVTIIDGQDLGPVIKCIDEETSATVIEGLTLRNGLANGAAPSERGGGLYCNESSPTIIDCVFLQNEAVIGGAFYSNLGHPTFTGCVFNQNHATSTGGVAYQNAGTVDYTDCVFSSNTSESHAGAIRHVSAHGTYTRCTFSGNEAGANGGAIDMAGGGTSSMTYRDCTFANNTADGYGGAVQVATPTSQTITWINCVFRGNMSFFGNGAAVNVVGRGVFINCTFYGNHTSGGLGGGAIYGQIGSAAIARNCIAWNNLLTSFGNVTATYCNVEGSYTGTGNINANPMFVNAGAGDLRLQEGSPCIDRANATLLPLSVAGDHDQQPRAVNAAGEGAAGVAALGHYSDMGAYEFQPEVAGPPNDCAADLNGDDVVNVLDLLLMLGAWGGCPG